MSEHNGYEEFAAGRWRTLVRSGVLLGCSLHDAEDLAQATLLRCYVKWASVMRASDLDAYVATVLVNQLRQSRRRRWWSERPTDDMPDRIEVDHSDLVDGTETVKAALAGLSREHREVVVLRYFLHLSERQIADALSVAPGTVKSRLSRALARLADAPEIVSLHLEDRP